MRLSHPNLIKNPSDRLIRMHEKRQCVLRFLRQHIWSSQGILQEALHLKSRQSTHKTLIQMKQAGLIRSHQFVALGGCLTIWGITAHGQAMAFNPDNEVPYSIYFEPSRVTEQSIRHQLDLQKLRLVAEANGWTNWIDGDRLGSLGKKAKRPDALANNQEGVLWAVECERTFKTTKRYEAILVSYLKMLRANQFSNVIWLLPTPDMASRLERLITGIEYVSVAGQKVKIDPSKHHANLYFCSYINWPAFCMKALKNQ